jgi:hypothetical protein
MNFKKKEKKKVKLAIHVNGPMDFLKFNNMFFLNYIFFNCMIKGKIDNHIIEFN